MDAASAHATHRFSWATEPKNCIEYAFALTCRIEFRAATKVTRAARDSSRDLELSEDGRPSRILGVSVI
jgi:hypothetical protein